MMELKPRDTTGEPDGVRVIRTDGGRRPALLWQTLALFFVASCAGYLLMPRRPSAAPPSETAAADPSRAARFVHAPGAPGAASAASGDAVAGTQIAGNAPAVPAPSSRRLTPRPASKRAEPERPPHADDPNEVASQFNGPPPADMTGRDYIQALHDAGIYEGIGAFGLPGTSPPLEGLAVPPDFELPEGFVRHHQTTDDGQAIDPILMFNPDFDFFDENGQRIPIPEDRVVPPEYAPPGFPIRPIVVPTEKRPEGDLGRR